MFHKIKEVNALDDYKLKVTFCEGVTKIYDVSRLFEILPVFKILMNNRILFSNVSVDTGGFGIVWNELLDLSCEELWDNGIIEDF